MADWKYNTPPNILLIDDLPKQHEKMKRAFHKYKFDSARSSQTAKEKARKKKYDLILLDLELNPQPNKAPILDGVDLIPYLQDKAPIIVISTHDKSTTIAKVIKEGAINFLSKDDFDVLEWTRLFDDVIKNRDARNEPLKISSNSTQTKIYPFIGESNAIQHIKKTLSLVAQNPDVTILITGETGVGKEVAARYLQQHSRRKNKPFEAINLTAITPTLLESTLFGHKKGAFTDAIKDVDGAFVRANGGILFLDEIGEINKELQVKILRVLETKTVTPVGGRQAVQLDIQIVTATNKNLKEEVTKENFREDLYYRLNVFPIEIPPLRERKEDIVPILSHHLESNNSSIQAIETETLQKLLIYDWPGNVRELVNSVTSMLLKMQIYQKEKIDMECLPRDIMESKTSPKPAVQSRQSFSSKPPQSSSPSVEILDYPTQQAQIELQAMEAAFIAYNGKKGDVAKKMGKTLDTLRYAVKKYYEDYPELFVAFPKVKKAYKLK